MPGPRFARYFSIPPTADLRPDAELLTRFLEDRDEAAMTALFVRHAPGVRSVCRGWLRSDADVDDAAQATFLVLVRRAETIRDRSAVGRWLLRTADLVARRLKREVCRAGHLTVDIEERAFTGMAASDAAALAAEVARLPAPYRLAIQLHYDAGLSAAAAADRLGCPRATVLTRLARGRRILHRRLLARGVTPTVAVVPTLAATPAWVQAVVRAAVDSTAGTTGLSPRSVSLSEGVVRAMTWKKLQLLAAAAMVATGLVGFALGQWATADGPKKVSNEPTAAIGALTGKAAKAEVTEPPATPGIVRREAVIRMPVGTFVKEVEVAPYGSGRITFQYEGDSVHARYELSVMGGELDFSTDAEISMASTGTIYGVLTGFHVTKVKLPPEMKAEIGGIDLVKAWPLVEPLANDIMSDLPFSYSVRQTEGRLVIQNFRMLLAGPNPLGKLGIFAAGGQDTAVKILGSLQAIGTALEGTYTVADPEKESLKKLRPGLTKPAPAKR